MSLRREHWQSILLRAFWLEGAPGGGTRFTTSDALGILKDRALPVGMQVNPLFNIGDAVRKTVGDYRSPQDVLVSYLDELQGLDMVGWNIRGWDPKRPHSRD